MILSNHLRHITLRYRSVVYMAGQTPRCHTIRAVSIADDSMADDLNSDVATFFGKSCAAHPAKLAFSSIFILIACLLLLSLSGCHDSDSLEASTNDDNQQISADDAQNPKVLTILAGSELKDIEPMLSDIRQHTGIQLKLTYTGTLDGVNDIDYGANVDAAWFSHGKYLSLVNRDKVKAQTPIMLSPVVMGVKQSHARALDWLDDSGTAKTDITWQDIAVAAKAGRLKYAMTNPAASNSGFTALMGVTSAFAGTSDAPTAADIAKAKPKLKDFFRGQALTSGSSGWLSEAYVKEQQRLDAMINYESVLLQLNSSGKLDEPLVLIYPKEGIVTADYPLTLLNFDKKASYDKVVAYLTSEEVQRRLMQQTYRRPVNNQVALAAPFYQGLLVELPFPNSRSIIDGLLIDFANELRNPAYALFLLDVSGSMRGDGISQLKQALLGLTGDATADDGSPAALSSSQDSPKVSNATNKSNASQISSSPRRFTQFAQNEVIGLKPFNNRSYPTHQFVISHQTLPQLRQDINALEPSGGTAIYQALLKGYQAVQENKQDIAEKRQNDPALAKQAPYYYSIVLMTDGKNQEGIDLQDFQTWYNTLPEEDKQVKTFVVLFGDADENEMQQIADLTGGRVFDGRGGNLSAVFRQIRGYQ